MRALLQDLRIRLASLLVRGVVRSASHDQPIEELQVEVAPGVLLGRVERMGGTWGVTSATPAEAEVVLGAIRGAAEHRVAVGVDDAAHRPTDLSTGDVALYNRAGDRVTLTDAREASLVVNGAQVRVSGSEIRLEVGASSIVLDAGAIAIRSPSVTVDP